MSDDRFGKKIRNASKSKVPFILIVGEEDMNNNAVSFRFRDGSQLNGVPVDTAREQILTVIKKRVQVNSADDFNAAVAEGCEGYWLPSLRGAKKGCEND